LIASQIILQPYNAFWSSGKIPEVTKLKEKQPSRVEIPIVEVKPKVSEAKATGKKERKVEVPVIEAVEPQHPKAKLTSIKGGVKESGEDVRIRLSFEAI
jgi:hypothetical protein